MSIVAISGDDDIAPEILEELAKFCKISLLNNSNLPVDYLLYQSHHRLELQSLRDKAIGSVYADFIEGKAKHRRLQGGGKGQQIAKAIGLHKIKQPTVLDVTAGLGRDAFVLATLGSKLTLLERSPIIYSLLNDAILRVHKSKQVELIEIIGRMKLIYADALSYMQKLTQKPDVIYIDPMFPERQKKAQVKKEMAFFHDIAGKDLDSAELLNLAKTQAKKRIVVKRPRLAVTLDETKPNFVITGKSTRYDVYLPSN